MKTLIFMKESDLHPAGGPAGYCYNIFQELRKQGIEKVEFLPGDSETKAKQTALYRKITSYFPKWINATQIAFRRKKDYQRMIEAPSMHNIDFSSYGVIHFHSTISLFKFRKDLENFEGKVLLTTHSPVPLHQEVYAELPTKLEKKLYQKFYEKLDQIDEYAFKRADYVVFPCEEAEESYLNNWKEYQEIHDHLKEQGKLVYIPTGIKPKKVVRDRECICKDYSLDSKQFIVSYAGRHNKIKGYDLLQQIAKDIWKRGYEYQFVICGKESPIHGLEDSRWKEIGWTNDSQSIIAASDVFILPNRETYFDIIMLEVISCGKIVIASRTGGNKFFEKIGAQGIFLYDTPDEAIGLIEMIAAMSNEEKRRLEHNNLELFNKCFTTDKYLEGYLDFLLSLE